MFPHKSQVVTQTGESNFGINITRKMTSDCKYNRLYKYVYELRNNRYYTNLVAMKDIFLSRGYIRRVSDARRDLVKAYSRQSGLRNYKTFHHQHEEVDRHFPLVVMPITFSVVD